MIVERVNFYRCTFVGNSVCHYFGMLSDREKNIDVTLRNYVPRHFMDCIAPGTEVGYCTDNRYFFLLSPIRSSTCNAARSEVVVMLHVSSITVDPFTPFTGCNCLFSG